MNPSIATININSPDVSPKNLKSSPSISPRETSSPRRKRRLQKGLSLKKIAVDQNQLTPDGQKTVSGKSLGVPKPQENKFELDESMLGSDVNEDKMGNIDIRIEDIPDVAPITLNLVENPPEQNNTIEEIDQRFSLEPKEELKLELADINDEQFQRRLIRRPSLRRRILTNEFSNEDLILIASFILRMEYNLRRKEDKENLVDCMRASVAFFSNYDRDTVNKCMKYMTYVKKKAHEIIFEVGTVGTTFWVLLKGSVIVRIPIKQPTGEVDAKGEPIMKEVLTDARVLPAGSGFGELALMNNKPRAATIVCKEDCELGVLEKEPFNSILRERETAKLFTEIDFLVSLPILKGWSFLQARKFFYVAPIVRYTRGSVLFNQGDEMMKVYIVKQGEFKISKSVTINKEGSGDYKDPLNTMFRKNLSKTTIELGILGEKELLGEYEIFSNSKREFQAVCHSFEALVFEITKKDFKDYIFKVDSSKYWLMNYIKHKTKFYNERLANVTKRHTPSEFQNSKKIIDMVPEQHENLKESFNEIVKHGLSVKRLKRFTPTVAPILSEEAEREFSPKKNTQPDSPKKPSPPRVEFSKNITPIRNTIGHTGGDRASDKTQIMDVSDARPITRGSVGVPAPVPIQQQTPTPERKGPVKLSIFKFNQEDEKKKIAERRSEFQKRMAKKRSERALATEPTERESKMAHSMSNVQLRNDIYISSQRSQRLRTESQERLSTIDNMHASFVPVGAYLNTQSPPKETHLNDSTDLSVSKQSITAPVYNFFHRIRVPSKTRREVSPNIKRQESNSLMITPQMTKSNPAIPNVNKTDIENRLKRTLANLHPQHDFKVNEDLGIRKQPVFKTGGVTLYNSTISKPPSEVRIDNGSLTQHSASTSNLHVLRMKEIDDMKSMYYKTLNSRTQRMRLIELVGSYYNEKGAHIIFDFKNNPNQPQNIHEEKQMRASTANPMHKRQRSKLSETKQTKFNPIHNSRSKNKSKEF